MWQRPAVAIHAIAQGGALQPVLAAIFAIRLRTKVLFSLGNFLGSALHTEAFQQTARTTRNPYRATLFSIRSLLQSRNSPHRVFAVGASSHLCFSGWLRFGNGQVNCPLFIPFQFRWWDWASTDPMQMTREEPSFAPLRPARCPCCRMKASFLP